MSALQIRDVLAQVDSGRLRASLRHLCEEPLRCRRANVRRPGAAMSTLDETDAWLTGQLATLGYEVTREAVQAQAFRCEMSKPKSRWYAAPRPADPWYTAHNLYAEVRGAARSDEIILVLAHKDSQSWVMSPGAYDNAVGTAGILEIARLVKLVTPQRTIRFLWCCEEHRPWTSVTAATRAAERGDNLVAIFNTDGIGGRPRADHDAGRRTNVTLYTTAAGRPFAELCSMVNEAYGLGLEQSMQQREQPGDDDGSFINAGFPHAIVNIGSYPYRHDYYHDERDVAADVDITNVAMAVQMILGAVLLIDRDGAPG